MPSLNVESGNQMLLNMWRMQLDKSNLNVSHVASPNVHLKELNQSNFSEWGTVSSSKNEEETKRLNEEKISIQLENERLKREKEIFLANLKGVQIENGVDEDEILKRKF